MATERDDLRAHGVNNPILEVIIQEKTDTGVDGYLGIKDDEVIQFIPPEMAFIKKGAMSSGKASVTFYAKNIFGEHIMFETSGAIIRMIVVVLDRVDG